MFLAETLTVLTEGLKRTFDGDYPVEDFRDLHVSIEYPAEEQHYPGVWVNFDVAGDLSIAGIGHREYLEEQTDDGLRYGEVTRWRFEGQSTFTLVSLSSLARARLLDEVVRVIGMGHLTPGRGAFRSWVHDNPLIGLSMAWDKIALQGMTETEGTPWGTDDILYEVTLAVDTMGEFTSDPTGLLVPLSEIRVFQAAEGQPDPRPGEGWG